MSPSPLSLPSSLPWLAGGCQLDGSAQGCSGAPPSTMQHTRTTRLRSQTTQLGEITYTTQSMYDYDLNLSCGLVKGVTGTRLNRSL